MAHLSLAVTCESLCASHLIYCATSFSFVYVGNFFSFGFSVDSLFKSPTLMPYHFWILLEVYSSVIFSKSNYQLLWAMVDGWCVAGFVPWHPSLEEPLGRGCRDSFGCEVTGKGFLDSSGLGSITLQLENDLETFSLISISLLHQCCLALS